MKTVALFGGSFNPPHPGHFEMAQYLRGALKADEVWLLFSTNWQKDPNQYAALPHRMEMGRILGAHYNESGFVMSGIQDELDTHITHDVLVKLQDRFPDHRFIWTMGADNLASFHTWEHSEDIMQRFAVAVVDRPPYTQAALDGATARAFAHLKTNDPAALAATGHGWCFLNNPKIEMSSSALLAKIRAGEIFDGPFGAVADYIRENKLYGIIPAPLPVPGAALNTLEIRS